MQAIAAASEGLSTVDVRDLMDVVVMKPIKRLRSAAHFKPTESASTYRVQTCLPCIAWTFFNCVNWEGKVSIYMYPPSLYRDSLNVQAAAVYESKHALETPHFA
jgi:hypothetical protein